MFWLSIAFIEAANIQLTNGILAIYIFICVIKSEQTKLNVFWISEN